MRSQIEDIKLEKSAEQIKLADRRNPLKDISALQNLDTFEKGLQRE